MKKFLPLAITEYFRKCPKCERLLLYKNELTLTNAKKNKSLCQSCSKLGNKRRLGIRHSLNQKRKWRIERSGSGNSFYGKQHTNKTKQKISQQKIGKRRDLASIEKQIKTMKVAYKTGKRKHHQLGKPISFNVKRKIANTNRLRRIKEIKNKVGQIMPNFNPVACKLIDEYGKQHGYNFQHALNGGEFHIKELGYFVDGYDKEKNVVIEYYEQHHKKKLVKDKIRKKEIKKYLKCEFIELWEY